MIMAKHKKKSLAKHQRKKRNRELKAIGEKMAEGFRNGIEEHEKGTDQTDRSQKESMN
jgi:hypothetical protein